MEDYSGFKVKVERTYKKCLDRQVKEGINIFDKGTKFFDDCFGKTFDEIIRDQVYKLIKYRGSFKAMTKSDFFIETSRCNEFYFNASHKVPFYYIYDCSPEIQVEMMTKYLENPFNPVMLVRYD